MDREKVIEALENAEMTDGVIKMSSQFRDIVVSLLKQEAVVNCISCTFYRSSDGQCILHEDRWKPEGYCSRAIRKKGR